MGKFLNKVICITGADGGIGKELLRQFALEGADLITCSLSKTSQYEKYISELKVEYGINIYPFYFDFADEISIKNGLAEIRKLKLKINVLINNAGMPHLAILPFTKIVDVKKVFQVNYFAHLQITQGVLSLLVRDEDSCIINTASIAGIDGDIGNSVYGATKASMILFTKVLSKELAASKIRVNAVAPGLTDTGFAQAMGEKAIESMKEISSMHRLGSPKEVASTMLFLASPEASFINGQVIRIDGGIK